MPYRRLPNTDQARIRALKMAVEKGEESNMYDLIYSLKTLTEARNLLLRMEGAQKYYRECYENQARSSRKHQANVKIARLYVSHFIQVLNMSVLRQEIKKTHKEFYGLPVDNYSVPDLTSEAAIVEWGRKIINGEQKRTAMGGLPIYNPTIAKVKVRYDIFIQGYEMQKNLQAITNRSLEDIASMRKAADEIILDIWNQVEQEFEHVQPNEERLNKCREYGVVYYYRSSEKLPQKAV
ncbi:hypothetical protein [Bacteroides sp. 224]|uniref:hypothetical protein n=1 Tax=Bacteroides sp. 224 TaxID=2302936 RepID=UPI0013D32751|nr:hypothetical protein [Bacteroides sp. 224]NDV65616.1 hypothetical protein [Bacteroides sp. 224]